MSTFNTDLHRGSTELLPRWFNSVLLLCNTVNSVVNVDIIKQNEQIPSMG